MRREFLGDGELCRFLNEEDEVKGVVKVEIVFNDGMPTGVLVGLKGHTLISFQSKKVEFEGNREQLFVSIEEAK